jgi:hypothetical protein
MGIADDILNSFLAANPQIREGNLSMEELNKLMNDHQQNLNNSPIPDFDGLSSGQMDDLLYHPMAPGNLLHFRIGMEAHVDKSPFFKLSEILIHEIKSAGNLKLTTNGNLPVRVCELLCSQNLINWPYMQLVKRVREEEIPYLWPLKQCLLDEGLVKKRNNALSLTKGGEKYLKEPAEFRFRTIFHYLSSRFHWANFYDLEDDGIIGRLGWGYSLLLLARYGDIPRISSFYGLKLMQAFEKDLWDLHQKGEEGSVTQKYCRAYDVRFFECFADWFGLVNIERKRDPDMHFREQLIITRSELFDQLFEVNPAG